MFLLFLALILYIYSYNVLKVCLEFQLCWIPREIEWVEKKNLFRLEADASIYEKNQNSSMTKRYFIEISCYAI